MATSFTIFCRRHDQTLRCAVRQDCPTPTFIADEAWMLVETIDTADPSWSAPIEFLLQAAHSSARVPGYYLFHVLSVGGI